MTSHVSRLPISLDQLIGEAKRRMRRRRLLTSAIAVALAIAAATLALRPWQGPGAPSGGSSGATNSGSKNLSLADYGWLSFRYPSSWKRMDKCNLESLGPIQSVTVLTTAKSPRCPDPNLAPSWPPLQHALGSNGVIVWIDAGQRGEVTGLQTTVKHVSPRSYCGRAGASLLFRAVLAPAGASSQFIMGACLRGPNLSSSKEAVRRMLASVRFKR